MSNNKFGKNSDKEIVLEVQNPKGKAVGVCTDFTEMSI